LESAELQIQDTSAQSDLVKRGDYLVNGILTCGNCHMPKGPSGDIMDKAFSGGASWDEPPFKVTAPNITQDKGTGIALLATPQSNREDLDVTAAFIQESSTSWSDVQRGQAYRGAEIIPNYLYTGRLFRRRRMSSAVPNGDVAGSS